MANLKEIRNRIGSVESTKQITSAMKMVSAAKLKRAQDAIIAMRPYAIKLQEILSNLTATLDAEDGGAYGEERKPEKVLLVPITSNRGLCGAFNANVLKSVTNLSKGEYAEQFNKGNLKLLTVGKKASEFFDARGFNIVAVHDSLYDDLTYSNVAPVAEMMMEAFVNGEYDKIVLVYNEFLNPASQTLVNEQFLPVEKKEEEESSSSAGDYIYEPGKEEIVSELIPKSLKTQFYKALLDSHAGEHGARMTAMHKATDNATELVRELKLSYNKARQAAITTEILEIVAGAEALNG